MRQRPFPAALVVSAGKRGHGVVGFVWSSVQCPVICFVSTKRQLYQEKVVAFWPWVTQQEYVYRVGLC